MKLETIKIIKMSEVGATIGVFLDLVNCNTNIDIHIENR